MHKVKRVFTYVPKILAELMMETTKNRLSLHSNSSLFCKSHKTEASDDHIQQFQLIAWLKILQSDIEAIKGQALKDMKEEGYK